MAEINQTKQPELVNKFPIRWVLFSLMPGVIISISFFGPGVVKNLLVGTCCSLMLETIISTSGKSPGLKIRFDLAILMGVLLGLAMPPNMSPAIVILAAAAAMVLARQVYYGSESHMFNPIMFGYALALILFPENLTSWPQSIDSITGPTALSSIKSSSGYTVSEMWSLENGYGAIGAYGWEWINAAFLLGGLLLITKKIISWHIPVSMLATITVLSIAFYDFGSSMSKGGPLFHLFSGSTMLVAFFIATDPATEPKETLVKLLYGCVIGTVTFSIRSWGNYPDGLAFGILVANALAPYLNLKRAERNV